ncbi:MAG: hypothetical protein ACI4QT_04390 [Kiritimatiellia bacterium]
MAKSPQKSKFMSILTGSVFMHSRVTVNSEVAMGSGIIALIKKVAERNGSIEYYPLQEFEEDGKVWLTCDGWLFAETSSEWLFPDVSDEEATTLLRAFALKEDCCTFEVHCHLARLMATKGGLVRDLMDSLVKSADWESYTTFPEASFLAVMDNGVEWILKVLDVVPNDGRDGILTACWYCEDIRVQEKLMAKFEEWTNLPAWGEGDGESQWMKQFISKWLANGVFSYERLKNLIMWHFKHEFLCL